jgi:hypothetical protein
MAKFLILLIVLFSAGRAMSATPKNTVELVISSPPVDASQTEQKDFFKVPSTGEIAADQSWSMMGREDRSAKVKNSEYQKVKCSPLSDPVSGLDTILDTISKRAKSHRIVIVNESHTITKHRDFTRQLLPKLRAQGFTVFAAEAFLNIDKNIDPVEEHNKQIWAHQNDGHYVKEVTFGRLVRSAKALGYRLAAYERVHDPNDKNNYNGNQRIERRETAQAENIVKILNSLRPDEKMLIHVGYSHAIEMPVTDQDTGFQQAWMAAKLKALTGLDPLTVVQTECRTGQKAPFLAKPSLETGPDILISHPVDRFKKNRPIWRREAGDVDIAIPSTLRPIDQPLVIEAFIKGEPFNSVPTDRIYVEPKENIPLLLPPGRYVVRAVKLKKQE